MVTAPEGMTKELWLKKCAAQFKKVCPSMTDEECSDLAEICFESVGSDLMEVPEDCADEEMSEWTDDGE
jgi:hypothetical protein